MGIRIIRYDGASYIAAGHDNGLKVRIYGSTGSVMWVQEYSDYLRYTPLNGSVTILSRGKETKYKSAARLSRVPAGHPEGYFEAFANIYLKFIQALEKKLEGEFLTAYDLDYP